MSIMFCIVFFLQIMGQTLVLAFHPNSKPFLMLHPIYFLTILTRRGGWGKSGEGGGMWRFEEIKTGISKSVLQNIMWDI